MTSSVMVWNLAWSAVIGSPGVVVVWKGASISVLVYVSSLTKTSAFMRSVGLIRSRISALPSFVTYRQTQPRDIMRNFGKLGFKNYLDSYDDPSVWNAPSPHRPALQPHAHL